MPEEEYACAGKDELMSATEITKIAEEFVKLGVNKIRLTGGEPMLRKDFAEILENLSQLPVELTITTNGVLVDKHLDLLKIANIKTINVSIDSLNEIAFEKITGRNMFQRVWKNIQLLLENQFEVKLNVVAMKGHIESELEDFIALTKEYPVEVRFIEFMPFTGNHWDSDKVITAAELIALAKLNHDVTPLETPAHATAKKYQIDNNPGRIAFISTMSSHFCSDCNRMRLTASGKIKNCLFGQDEIDILSAIRNNLPIDLLIKESVNKKHKALGGQFSQDYKEINAESIINSSMIAIGG
jgi:cyclic pyranopterin phosphate synthase